jgi:Zn-finger nucleic acid-binding protein
MKAWPLNSWLELRKPVENVMKCPSCAGAMNVKIYEGVSIDVCGACQGTWLDWGKLGGIVENRDETFDYEERIAHLNAKGEDRNSKQSINCPHCSQVMERFEYAVNSGVILDRCPKMDGLWFDPGELEKIQIVMEEFSHGVTSTQADQVRDSFDSKQCPRCKNGLREWDYEGIQLDQCPSCRGYWCDQGELREILRRREMEFSSKDHQEIKAEKGRAQVNSRPEDSASELKCVLCQALMERFNYDYSSGVILDRCPRGHGLWFDEQELAQVQIFVERWEEAAPGMQAGFSSRLKKTRDEVQERHAASIDATTPSRFGPVNRLIQSLLRRGFI